MSFPLSKHVVQIRLGLHDKMLRNHFMSPNLQFEAFNSTVAQGNGKVKPHWSDNWLSIYSGLVSDIK